LLLKIQFKPKILPINATNGKKKRLAQLNASPYLSKINKLHEHTSCAIFWSIPHHTYFLLFRRRG
jgi:hypothetical protein